MDIIVDIETLGLNFVTDRIICISIHKEDKISTFAGNSEQIILEDFWKEVSFFDTLIGFNSTSFDIPFLLRRSLINNVRTSKFANHIDLREIVNCYFYKYDKYIKGTLNYWAEVMGIKVETNGGKEMPKLFELGKWTEIIEHCSEDIMITKKLYDRCRDCNLL